MSATLQLPKTAERSRPRVGGTSADPKTSLRKRLGTEAPPLVVLAVFAAGAFLLLDRQLVQDGWLALLDGRLVAHSGIPHHDTLAAWTRGTRWVDQQWLGQLMLYELARLGGLKLALLASAFVSTVSVAWAFAAARLLGGSPRRLALVSAFTLPIIAMETWHLRTQVLAVPLFLATLWLLLRDRAQPSGRVLWVVPALAVWANVHGSVLLGSALVGISGLLFIAEALRDRYGRRGPNVRHGLLLLAIATAACFISPYGLSVLSYYSHTALNPGFVQLVTEWQKTTLSVGTAPFFAAAAASLWMIGRSRRLGAFESLVLVVLMGAGLLAVRNLLWFALAVLVLLPRSLDEVLSPDVGREDPPVLRQVVAVLSIVAIAVVALMAALRPTADLRHGYPATAASVVALAAEHDRSLQIYASEKYSDWLLWTHPELSGRVAFDTRFELLTRPQLERIAQFKVQVGPDWRRAIEGSRLLVLRRGRGPAPGVPATVAVVSRDPGVRQLYAGQGLIVLLRPT